MLKVDRPDSAAGWALVCTSTALGGLYGSIVCVALVTSNLEVLRDPVGLYAALVPLLYCGGGILIGSLADARKLKLIIFIVANLAIIPCLRYSFLHLGYFFPPLGILMFWVIFRGRNGKKVRATSD